MELIMNTFNDYLNSQEYQEHLMLFENAKIVFDKQCKDFFDSLEYDDQLKVFYHVVKNIYEGCLIDQGSYRHIIYNKFNFGPDSYALGMDCGLLELNNSIYSHEEISNALKDILKHLDIQVDSMTFNKLVSRFTYGYFGSTDFRNRSMQLALDFNDN